MRVLVTGASGFVGSAVVGALEGLGHTVVRLVRRPGPLANQEWFWDPIRGEVDARIGAGVDAVVHLAGENIASGRWTASLKARIRESRVQGTQVLVGALSRAARQPAVFISASATGIYGDRGDEVLDENSESGHSFLADVAVSWEQAAASLSEAGTRVATLRIGMVLGPDGGALKRMTPIFRRGMGGVLGSGNQYWSWIHREDLVRIIVRAITDSGIRGPVNAVAPKPVRNREFTRTLATVIGRPALVRAPAFGLRLILGEMADAVLLASTRVVPKYLHVLGHQWRFAELRDALVDGVQSEKK
jgi:uncharacterized protein